MERFDVSFNQLDGSLPVILGSYRSLISLRLNSNHFTGQLPNSYRLLITNRLEVRRANAQQAKS